MPTFFPILLWYIQSPRIPRNHISVTTMLNGVRLLVRLLSQCYLRIGISTALAEPDRSTKGMV